KAAVDPGQIRQALWNLCLNAIEAMPDGGELRSSVRAGGASGPIEVTVQDTGVGIPPGDRPHLFEPFFSTKPSGTGLGLAIVHRVVEDHEAEIRVESEPGQGTRVTVTLPGREA